MNGGDHSDFSADQLGESIIVYDNAEDDTERVNRTENAKLPPKRKANKVAKTKKRKVNAKKKGKNKKKRKSQKKSEKSTNAKKDPSSGIEVKVGNGQLSNH